MAPGADAVRRAVGEACGFLEAAADRAGRCRRACDEALRLFPERPVGHPSWPSLLWCTGRLALPGLPRRTTWRWQSDWRSL